MNYKSIVVHIDGEDPHGVGARRRAYAVSLARLFGARLTGLVFALEPAMAPMVMGEVPGTMLESERKSSIAAAEASAEAFRTECARADVDHEMLVVEASEASAPGIFARQARVADLVVVGQAPPDDTLAIRELILEAALFDSGRPVLVVPHADHDVARFERALVAWDGDREAARAAHDALPLLRQADHVEVVVVDDDHHKPVKGEPGADLAAALARHGLEVTAHNMSRRDRVVSDVLLTRAADTSAHLVVMGGYGHSRLREFILGGATRGILDTTTVPVLMAH